MKRFRLCFQIPTAKMLWPLLLLNFIGHIEIIIKYYWNETFIAFVDSFTLVRTFTDRYKLIKANVEDRDL